MNKFLHSLIKHSPQRGQSLVEMSISLLVILMLLVGAVDFGMAFFSFSAIRDAAQEGALYGSINGDKSGTLSQATIDNICARVRETSTNNPVHLNGDDYKANCNSGVTSGNYILVELAPDAASGGKDCQGLVGADTNGIKVTVGYDYPTIMPFLGRLIGSQTIQLRATAVDTILTPQC
ncbi:MAG TPA: TadE family protein [Anaerolineales bacterium]|jgi:Flp pilus assembly protein TadG|nr:TadE family protein [Anaerolineales bacterium]